MGDGRLAPPRGRALLVALAGRRLLEVRQQVPDGALLQALVHAQLATARVAPGDRLYLSAFSEAKELLLFGQMNVTTMEQGRATAAAPFSRIRHSFVVPEDTARVLESADGARLRFARASAYELHPLALRRPIELNAESAAKLDRLLDSSLAPHPAAASESAPAPSSPPPSRSVPPEVGSPSQRDSHVPDARPAGLSGAWSRLGARLRGSRSPTAHGRSPLSGSPAASPARPVPGRSSAETRRPEDIPVEEVLGPRASNALRRPRVSLLTLGAVVTRSRDELLAAPGLGTGSLDEIERVLESYGLQLRRPRRQPEPDPGDRGIDQLGLSVPAYVALAGSGVKTLGDLMTRDLAILANEHDFSAAVSREVGELAARYRQRPGQSAASGDASESSARPQGSEVDGPGARRSAISARDLDILKRRDDGETLASIAASHGVSRERIRQIVNAHRGVSARGGRHAGAAGDSQLGARVSQSDDARSNRGAREATRKDLESRARAWHWDELVLALDLYKREGQNASPTSCAELSELLRAMPVERHLSKDPRFRSASSVALKLANIGSIDPARAGGMPRGSARDREVWDAFASRPDLLAREVRRVLGEIAGATGDRPRGRDRIPQDAAAGKAGSSSRRNRFGSFVELTTAGFAVVCEACGHRDDSVATLDEANAGLAAHRAEPRHVALDSRA